MITWLRRCISSHIIISNTRLVLITIHASIMRLALTFILMIFLSFPVSGFNWVLAKVPSGSIRFTRSRIIRNWARLLCGTSGWLNWSLHSTHRLRWRLTWRWWVSGHCACGHRLCGVSAGHMSFRRRTSVWWSIGGSCWRMSVARRCRLLNSWNWRPGLLISISRLRTLISVRAWLGASRMATGVAPWLRNRLRPRALSPTTTMSHRTGSAIRAFFMRSRYGAITAHRLVVHLLAILVNMRLLLNWFRRDINSG